MAGKIYTWSKPQEGLAGFCPEPRVNHTLTLLPKEYGYSLVMVGGRLHNGQHSGVVWKLDVGDINPPRQGTWLWTEIVTNPAVGEPPVGREGHSASVFRNNLLIFGGLSLDGLLNDVMALDLDFLEWHKPPVAGMPPIRRYQHSSCTFARKLVIFGGFSEYGDVEHDLHALDMATYKWSTPGAQGAPPAARMGHTATRHDHNMIVYGGYCVPEGTSEGGEDGASATPSSGMGVYLSDVYILDTQKWVWSKPKINGPVPNALNRCGHTAERLEELILVLGGRTQDSGPSKPGQSAVVEPCDGWILDMTSWSWSKMSAIPENASYLLPSVSSHASVLYGAPYSQDRVLDTRTQSRPKLIIFGGDTYLSKMHILDIPQIDWSNTQDVFLPELESLGNQVVSRSSITESRNFQLIDTELKFSRPSVITHWQVWVEKEGTIRLQVYREVPKEGRAAQFKQPYRLVGENIVHFIDTEMQRATVPEKERITVREGDMIGFRLDGDNEIFGAEWPNKLTPGERVDKFGMAGTPSGVVSFDYGKAEVPTDPTSAHTGHRCRFTTHDYMGIGSVLDFDNGMMQNHLGQTLYCYRTYSIKAFFVPAEDQSKSKSEHVQVAEPEEDLLYLLGDPTLRGQPRQALEEVREYRLLHPTKDKNTSRRKKVANPNDSSIASPGKVGNSSRIATTNRSMAGGASSREGSPSRKTRGGGDASKVLGGGDGGKGKGATGKGPSIQEGASSPMKVPMLDGRRLPEGERLPKELDQRERGGGGGGASARTGGLPVFDDEEVDE